VCTNIRFALVTAPSIPRRGMARETFPYPYHPCGGVGGKMNRYFASAKVWRTALNLIKSDTRNLF
jgi:hypothetical protein